MREREYQAYIIRKLKEVFPDCVILKNDPDYLQGVPDLLILVNDRWAMLEVKASAKARVQNNQEFYVNSFNAMSYSSFIYPENEEKVFNELQSAFSASW